MSTQESGRPGPHKPVVIVEGMPVFGAAVVADIETHGPIESDGQSAETGVQTTLETLGQVGVATVLNALRLRDPGPYVPPAEKPLPPDHTAPLRPKPPLYVSGNHAY